MSQADNLNYHHLYYFKVIASEGSISNAAKVLRLGQPTLSMQLKQFEEAIGHKLFERNNRNLILTEMGRLVLGYANEIFRLGDEMMDTIHDRPHQKQLRLQIGALDSIPKFLIRSLMSEAYKYTDCQISVLEGEGPELVEDLLSHHLDLVISNVPAPALSTERLHARSLVKMPLIVVGAKRFAHLKEGFPQSLNGQPMVYPTDHSRNRREIENFFDKQKVRPKMIAEAQDTSLMKSLAIEEHGMIVVAEPAVKGALSEGILEKIGELPGFFEELWLISAQRKLQNPIAEKLLNDFQFDPSGPVFDPARASGRA